MKLISACLLLAWLAVPCALGETLSMEEMLAAQEAPAFTEDAQEVPAEETPEEEPQASAARGDFIDRIIADANALYKSAGGRPQRAQYSGDIYV